MKSLALLLGSCLIPLFALAQSGPVKDLGAEIAAGRLQLTALAGNGNSSGNAVTGELVNTTSSKILVDITLSEPPLIAEGAAAKRAGQ